MVDKFYYLCHNEGMDQFDDRAASYMRYGDFSKAVAEKVSGVEVDETTHVRWRHAMGLLREVDTLADSEEYSSPEIIAMLRDFSLFSDRYPSLVPEGESEHAHERALKRTERLLKLGHQIVNADTMQRFLSLRLEEGRHSAQLLADIATDDVREQQAFREYFIPAMESLAIGANLVDSALDGYADRRKGQLNVPVGPMYYQGIALSAIRHTAIARKVFTNPSVIKEISSLWVARLAHTYGKPFRHEN